MENILLTGASGFIGSNIVGCLNNAVVFCPTRVDLDLLDADAVRQYVIDNDITVIVHAAHPNPVKNSLDIQENMLQDSIEMFLSIYRCADLCRKIIVLGSGAEYDKSRDICSVSEDDFGQEIPEDAYGLAKYIESMLALEDENVYILRVFGCYGPGDYYTKFITHAIRSVLAGVPITIKQNCWFDYLHVSDLGRAIDYIIHHDMPHHIYNAASGQRQSLSHIALTVCRLMDARVRIDFLAGGCNREYTANADLIKADIPGYPWTSLEEGIKRQIEYEISIYPENGYEEV